MLKNYIKIAWKVLGRNRFFSFVSLFGISFTLAILIVVSTFIDHFMNPGYPNQKGKEYVYVRSVRLHNPEEQSSSQSPASFYFLEKYVKKLSSPSMVAIASSGSRTNTFVDGKKLKLNTVHTCPVFWEAHDFEFLNGRPYTQQEIDDNAYVAVISKATREKYFGDRVEAVGKWVETDNVRYRVIGVIENVAVTRPLVSGDVYVPYNTDKADLSRPEFLGGYTGIMVAEDQQQVRQIKSEFEDMVARIELPEGDYYTEIISWAETLIESASRAIMRSEEPAVGKLLAIIFTGMFMFMLIPALNLINLNSSRIMERASEIGVRKAFGATSSTLTIQFLVENILLTLLGGVIGFLLAWLILHTIESSGAIPYAELSMNLKVLFGGLLLIVCFGLLSGVLPALRMSRMQIVHAIKGGEL